MSLSLFHFSLQKLVQGVSQFCTSLEFCNLLGTDGDLLLGGGVDTFTSGALADAECTKAYESDFVTCDESVLNSCNASLKSLLCINL